jgi:predicted TIM-barrel fold metal-dependent hydrolase
MTRRFFLFAAAASAAPGSEPIIDIHQHTNYLGRNDDDLIEHQRALGAARTILLPAGSKFGLAADAGGNESCWKIANQLPGSFSVFANELPGIPETAPVLEKYLKAGAKGIGEQKFAVEVDSTPMQAIYEIAQQYRVPVLLHFQHETYNMGFERFYKILEKYPKVNFIGHAQTWWANIDRDADQKVMYPKTKVNPGGITDRLLTAYPNMFGDMSAGSGVNALLRDEDHARSFLDRHQNKLLFGSDCNCRAAGTVKCIGTNQISAIKRLAPNQDIVRKILYKNAATLLNVT